MAVAILNTYLLLLFVLVHFNIVPWNLFWKASPFLVLLLTLFGLLIPMGWSAPQGTALVVRNAVSIVPDVAGEVTEVPVVANTPLKAGDILFKIDATPYEAQVKAIGAELKLAKTRLGQMTQLFEQMPAAASMSNSGSPRSIISQARSRERNGISTKPSCAPRPTAM
jgi:multidrug resistance efflux pump